jgi:hypothetical protein
MLEVQMTKVVDLNSQLAVIKSEFKTLASHLRPSGAADLLDNAVASLDDVIRFADEAMEAE